MLSVTVPQTSPRSHLGFIVLGALNPVCHCRRCRFSLGTGALVIDNSCLPLPQVPQIEWNEGLERGWQPIRSKPDPEAQCMPQIPTIGVYGGLQ